MIPPAFLPVLAWLAPALAPAPHEIERGAPWYWPTGSPYGTHRVLQAYGQYQTFPGVFGSSVNLVHGGLDVEANPGDPVRAPFAGTVLSVEEPSGLYAHYGMVVLARPGTDWALTLTHLKNITVAEGDELAAGEELGQVVAWPGLTGFDHVHLGLIETEPFLTSGDYEYITDPLAFLGGHADEFHPAFESIDLVGATLFPVAFAKDDPTCEADLTFYADHTSLPAEKLDVLAVVTDRLAPSKWAQLLVVIPLSSPFWPGITLTLRLPAALYYPVTTPAHLSLRITRISDGEVVVDNAIDFTGGLATGHDYPYRHPTGSVEHVTGGWPNGPFYFLLTNQLDSNGFWDVSHASSAGEYLVEVTAEDLAGNQAYESLLVKVK